jgi:hypothetical protein
MRIRHAMLGSTLLAAAFVLGTTAPGFTEGATTKQMNTTSGTQKVDDPDQNPGSGAQNSRSQQIPKTGQNAAQQHNKHKASTTGSGSSSMKSTTGSGANSKQMNTTSGTKKVDDPDQDKGSGAQNSNVGRTMR